MKHSNYKLQIIPGRCPVNYQHIDFHNQVYSFWKNFWNEVFKENGTDSKVEANIFYRQDFVAVVTCGQDIVGTIFHTSNNFQSSVVKEISYFDRPYVREICQTFEREGKSAISTYEMLTVNKKFRKNVTGISFGSVLLGITAKVFLQSENPVMIGPVRLDNGVDKLVRDFGWRLLSDPYSMHGTPVAVSALFRNEVKESADSNVQGLINSLWENRKDLRLVTKEITEINAYPKAA